MIPVWPSLLVKVGEDVLKKMLKKRKIRFMTLTEFVNGINNGTKIGRHASAKKGQKPRFQYRQIESRFSPRTHSSRWAGQ